MTFRHERTKLFLQEYIEESEKFFATPIMVTAGDTLLNTSNGKIMLESAINLISRFADRLAIKVPDSFQDIALNMKKMMVATGCEIEDSENFEPKIVLSVGPTDVKSEFVVQINSFGWVSYVSCNSNVKTFSTDNENPVGAMGAACFGSAEVFKRILETNGCKKRSVTDHPKQACFSFKDYSLFSDNKDFPRKIDIGKILLVGAGAVGSGFLYALSKIDKIQGDIVVLDHDGIDSTNLNRCLPYFVDDVDKPKASICERLSKDGLQITGHAVEYDKFQIHEKEFPIIVSTVDNNNTRYAIQHDLPKIIFHAATGGIVSAVAVFKMLENACMCCIFEDSITYEEIISNETGIPVDVVDRALKQKLPFTEEHYGFVCKKLGNSAAQFQNSIGKPFETVYQKEICGMVSVETNNGKKSASVPFVSFFSGLCAASELIKYHSKSFDRLPMRNELDFLQVSLFALGNLNLAHRPKNPRCSMECSDESLQGIFSKKWSLQPTKQEVQAKGNKA